MSETIFRVLGRPVSPDGQAWDKHCDSPDIAGAYVRCQKKAADFHEFTEEIPHTQIIDDDDDCAVIEL